jgi:hypothetical protein
VSASQNHDLSCSHALKVLTLMFRLFLMHLSNSPLRVLHYGMSLSLFSDEYVTPKLTTNLPNGLDKSDLKLVLYFFPNLSAGFPGTLDAPGTLGAATLGLDPTFVPFSACLPTSFTVLEISFSFGSVGLGADTLCPGTFGGPAGDCVLGPAPSMFFQVI